MVAATMCDDPIMEATLFALVKDLDSSGITDKDYEDLLLQIVVETAKIIWNPEKEYEEVIETEYGVSSCKELAKKIILAAVGVEDCETTYAKLRYVEHVTADPRLKDLVREVASQIAAIDIYRPRDYEQLLKEAQEAAYLWELNSDDWI